MKVMVFKIAPNITKHLGYFYKTICYQKLLKVAQSGYTGSERENVSVWLIERERE